MKQERKICFRITPGRIAGAVLIVASVVNLAIVGAVAAVASSPPTVTPSITISPSMTSTGFEVTAVSTQTPTSTATSTLTETATVTLTASATPTNTATLLPSPTLCSPQYSWPIYTVRGGDTLFSIGLATGATVVELKLANCLIDNLIYPGQPLHVPRLPPTPTFTPTLTPSVTVIETTLAPVDTPTDIQNPEALSCYPYAIDFSVTVYDQEGIASVSVLLYDSKGLLLDRLLMKPDGDRYYASSSSGKYQAGDIASYYFSAMDVLGNTTMTQKYDNSSIYCPVG